MDSDYFEEGLNFYEEKNYDLASERFQYIVNHYAGSDYYEDAVYNLGIIFMLDEEYSNAINTFLFILKSDVEDTKYIGGDIMSNPFANYKHKSASCLYSVYYKLEKYDSALIYLSYSDSLYPLQSSCGNEIEEYVTDRAICYADVYAKLGEKSKSISSLLAAVWGPYSENRKPIELLKELLQEEPSVLKEFEKSIKKMKMIRNDGNCLFVLQFRETNLVVPSYFSHGKKCNRKFVLKAIKKSELYQMFESL